MATNVPDIQTLGARAGGDGGDDGLSGRTPNSVAYVPIST
jgi:hypothetical protein